MSWTRSAEPPPLGCTTYTLWGEIASQLGEEAWAAVAEHDEHRTAPGTEAIRKMLDGGPAVIVIDEIAQHLRVCSKSARQDVKDQADQVAPFLKNLSEEVMSRDDVVVVIHAGHERRRLRGRD